MVRKFKDISQNDDYQPKDYYKELAEYGLLDDFIRDRMKGRYELSEEFRAEIIADIIKYSEVNIPQIDKLYLEKLTGHLETFIEKANQC